MKVWRSTFVFHCFSSVFWYAWHGNQQTHCLGRSSVRPQRWHYYRVCFPWGGWLGNNADIILVTSDYEHLPICCSILFFSFPSLPKIGWYWPATARVQGLPKSSVMTRPSPNNTLFLVATLATLSTLWGAQLLLGYLGCILRSLRFLQSCMWHTQCRGLEGCQQQSTAL